MQYTFNRTNVISYDIKIAPFHKLNQLFESHPRGVASIYSGTQLRTTWDFIYI